MVAATLSLIVAAPARAASLSPQITGFTTANVPVYVSMFEYVPAKLATSPPVVVAAHYCGGNASGMFGEVQGAGVVSSADQYGFLMIFPQTSNNCWDVGSTKSLTHDGGGDTQAIAEMVKYAIAKQHGDADRVYVMGSSSGAMMTEALLAVYPDVFKAGAEFSGVPAGCWSASYNPSNEWSSPCASGMVSKTAQQWGDLVRAMYPGYSGYRPRVQLWHGTADTTINYNNQGEAIKEWTNVLGLSTSPTTTDSPMSGYTHESWKSTCGFTVLEAWTQQNGGHTTPIDGQNLVAFFGLDKSGPDPEVAACGDAGPPGGGGVADGGGGTTDASGAMTGSSGSAGNPGGGGGGSSGAGSGGVGSTSGDAGAGSSGGNAGNGGNAASGGAAGGVGAAGGAADGGVAGGGRVGIDGGGEGAGGAGLGESPSGGGGGCIVARGSPSPGGEGAGGALAMLSVLAIATRRGRRRRG